MVGEKPVLWHIRISHYSEKARWALAHKGIDHERRVTVPGAHMAVALWLTRGRQYTFPVLELEGENVGDSTAIIAALERRFPDPPLYPEDDEERHRALALEDFFDEELGPHIRLVGWHEMTRDPERLTKVVASDLPGPVRALRGAPAGAARYATTYTRLRFGVKSEERASLGRSKVLAALDRLEAELNGNEYLVGDRFTVADLTAAALFYPLVLPPEGPPLGDPPEASERFRAPLKDRPGYKWVEETFRRHRNKPPKASASPTFSAGLGASRLG
jgi:glutathione S-transferase